MSQELIYTSVPRGLRPGTSGFCTVAMTARMPDATVQRLESLSAYRPVFPLGDSNAARNPIIWAHWRLTVGDRPRSVLSRVAFAGADYSQRSNKFAHHLVLEPNEMPPGGPAWVLGQPGVMLTQWSGDPQLLPAGRSVPRGDEPPAVCWAWQSATGDAGWAAALADAFVANPEKPAFIVYQPGVDLLPLIAEAISLLPASLRWQVTFCTYFTELPIGATCAWRCIVADSPAAKAALRSASRPLIIDLTKPLGVAPPSALAEAARTGRPPISVSTPPVKTLAGAAAGASGILPFREEDPIEPAAPAAQPTIRRRLNSGPLAAVEESGADDLEIMKTEDAWARPAVKRRGIPVWAATLMMLVGTGIGAGLGYEYGSSRMRQPVNPKLVEATQPSQSQGEGERGPNPEHVIQAKVAEPTPRPVKAPPPTTAQSAQTRPVAGPVAEAPSNVERSQTRPTESDVHSPQVPTHTESPQVPTTREAAAPDVRSAQLPAHTESQRGIAQFDPPPTLEEIRKLRPNNLGEIKILHGGTGKLVDSQDFNLDGVVSKILLLFPNGTSTYTVEGRALSCKYRGDTLSIEGPSSEDWISKLIVKDKSLLIKLNVSIAPSDKRFAILPVSTLVITYANQGETKLYCFRSCKKTEGGLDKTFSLALPPSDVRYVSNRYITLAIQPTATPWKGEFTDYVAVLSRKGLDCKVSITGSITDGQLQLKTDWMARRKEYFENFKDRLSHLSFYNSSSPPNRTDVIAMSRIAREDIDKQKDILNGSRNDAQKSRAKEMLDKENSVAVECAEILKFDAQIHDFFDIGPIICEVRLLNGFPIELFEYQRPTGDIARQPWR